MGVRTLCRTLSANREALVDDDWLSIRRFEAADKESDNEGGESDVEASV
jgi:hypothetical protein